MALRTLMFAAAAATAHAYVENTHELGNVTHVIFHEGCEDLDNDMIKSKMTVEEQAQWDTLIEQGADADLVQKTLGLDLTKTHNFTLDLDYVIDTATGKQIFNVHQVTRTRFDIRTWALSVDLSGNAVRGNQLNTQAVHCGECTYFEELGLHDEALQGDVPIIGSIECPYYYEGETMSGAKITAICVGCIMFVVIVALAMMKSGGAPAAKEVNEPVAEEAPVAEETA